MTKLPSAAQSSEYDIDHWLSSATRHRPPDQPNQLNDLMITYKIGAHLRARVHVRFVGNQDHFRVSAGKALLVWLCTYGPDERLTGYRRR